MLLTANQQLQQQVKQLAGAPPLPLPGTRLQQEIWLTEKAAQLFTSPQAE